MIYLKYKKIIQLILIFKEIRIFNNYFQLIIFNIIIESTYNYFFIYKVRC